jgi:hypothetical protein
VLTFFAEAPTHGDPYSRPGGYFQGEQPSELLAGFPWSDLQLLRMRLHAGTCTARASRRGQSSQGACR